MKTPTRKRAAKATVRKVARTGRPEVRTIRNSGTQKQLDEQLTLTAVETLILLRARLAQTCFWKAVSDLERHLGFEIDSSQDLEDVSIEDLKASKGAPV